VQPKSTFLDSSRAGITQKEPSIWPLSQWIVVCKIRVIYDSSPFTPLTLMLDRVRAGLPDCFQASKDMRLLLDPKSIKELYSTLHVFPLNSI